MNLPAEEREKYHHFLELLRETPRDWYVERVVAKGAIRRVHFPPTRHLDVECPISSIERQSIDDFMRVADRLGFSDMTMQMILRAADFSGPPMGCEGEPSAADVAECRRDLMKNCGLTHLLTAGSPQLEVTVEETLDAVLVP